jgi:hypothetical protein
MANPNIVNVTTVTGKTSVLAVTTTATAVVENTAASGKVFKINSIIIANVDGTNAADVTVDLFRSSVAYPIASTITVPAGATLVVLSKETAIYLEEGDSIRCTASANGDLVATCSYEEIS